MLINNGIIVSATETELYSYWLPRYSDIMSFPDFLEKFKGNGGIVADRKEIDGNTAEWEQLEQIEAYDIAGTKTWAVKRMCNNCGLIHAFIEDHTTQYKFCPQCGSRMVAKVVKSHAD